MDAIVVGAGPVGLMLAIELRLGGVTPVVLEARTGPTTERKARGIGPLATEALGRRGLGDRIAAFDAQGRAEFARDHGSPLGHFAHLHKIDQALQAEPERDRTLIWQPDLERVLAEYAAELGIEVRHGHTVTALTADDAGVTAQTTAGPVQAPYLVGCDGGRSTVRRAAGFDFPGTEPVLVTTAGMATVADPDALPPSGRHPGGVLMHGGGRLGTMEPTPPGWRRDDLPTARDLEDSVRRVCGAEVTITELHAPSRWGDQARQPSTYRRGRVLLAGDAAHVHSPNGGQGLNLGLMDAVNLGWKLAATVRGTAPAGLLDTYTAERHPAGAAVLANTRAQSALLLPGEHVTALRDLVSALLDITVVNQYFGRLLSGLDTRYPLPGNHPLTGTHCPDLTLTVDGAPVPLNTFTRGAEMLLIGPPGLKTAHANVVTVQDTGRADLAAALLRPDGVVAWATGTAGDTEGLAAALRAYSPA